VVDLTALLVLVAQVILQQLHLLKVLLAVTVLHQILLRVMHEVLAAAVAQVLLEATVLPTLTMAVMVVMASLGIL
jgi:hypothetical protein